MDDKIFERISQQAYKEATEETIGGNSITDIDLDEENIGTESEQPVDLLQTERSSRREMRPRNARGARPKAQVDLSLLGSTGLQQQYKKAKDDSDYYTWIGNLKYAQMVKQQYMEDYFLPALDAMVKLNGMEAMLANTEALSKLDELTLLDGTRGNGYTETFIRSMYDPEVEEMGIIENSDAQVQQAIRDITYLCETDQIRSAVGRANDIKRSIDNGDNVASEEDYETIQRVALYGS